jgi:hypothetical protein
MNFTLLVHIFTLFLNHEKKNLYHIHFQVNILKLSPY